MKRGIFLVLILCVLVLSLGAQTGADGYEPNDSASAASPVKPGRYNLSFTDGDTDWFSFKISSPVIMRIYTEGDLDTCLGVYGPNDHDLEIGSDDDGGEDYNARLSVNLSDADTYYIQAGPYDGDTGSYVLVLEAVEFRTDRMEPNNSRAQAKALDVSRPPSELSLFPAEDEDWFKLDLRSFQYREGEVLAISTTGEVDTYMTIFQGGTLVEENDDSPESVNARIVFFPERGVNDYYLVIRGYDGAVVGEYGIAVETAVTELDQYEPNNTMARATAASPGRTLSGSALADYDPVDWFSFTITQPGTYAIGTTGGLDSLVVLYDKDGGELNSDDDSGKDGNALIETPLDPGTYYARVTQYGSSYQEYSFYVRPR
jgi:hypothetical protein